MSKRLSDDEYMAVIQAHVVPKLPKKYLDSDQISFRLIDTVHLIPRYRVEIAVLMCGEVIELSCARVREPLLVAKAFNNYIRDLVIDYENEKRQREIMERPTGTDLKGSGTAIRFES